MSINLTGIYEPTYDDITAIQSDITNLYETIIYTISGLPYAYAGLNEFNNFKTLTENNFYDLSSNLITLTSDYNLFKTLTINNFFDLSSNFENYKTFTDETIYNLSSDYDLFKTLTINNIFDLSTNIILLNDNLITLGNDYDLFKSYTYTTFYDISSTFMNMASTIDEQFLITYQYIDVKDREQKTYTDDEVTQLRNEGMIQEAVTQILAWITSDEGKRFRKKVWDKIKYKWLTFSGSRPYSELSDDIDNAITDELDDSLKVYRYKDGI